MSYQKVRQADLDFIEKHACDMSERELASELRLSKTTVHRMKRRLGLVDADAPGRHAQEPPGTVAEDAGEAVDRAVFLRRHARRLEQRMPGASDSALAMLSKEYRATLEELAALDGAGKPGSGQQKRTEVTPFDVILGRNAGIGKAAQA